MNKILEIFFCNLVNMLKRSAEDLLEILRKKDFKKKLLKIFKDLNNFFQKIFRRSFENFQLSKKVFFTWFIPVMRSYEISHQ